MKIGIQYRFPWIYKLTIPIIHRPSVLKEFKRQVGKNVGVFEIAAGFGHMADYIDPSNSYEGIDLNKTYVRHAQKRGLKIKVGDIFEKRYYSRHDTFILVDVVHHMPHDRLTELFDLIFSHADKRVVIMEPAFLNLGKRYGLPGRAIDWVFKKLDSDGVNTINAWMTDEEYTKLFKNKFSSKAGKAFSVEIKKIYPYYIVTYSKSA